MEKVKLNYYIKEGKKRERFNEEKYNFENVVLRKNHR